MAESYRICPICETHNHPNAALCLTCGASIEGIAPEVGEPINNGVDGSYDFRYGESDLLEGSLDGRGQSYIVMVVTAFLVVAMGFIGLQLLTMTNGGVNPSSSNGGNMPTRPALEIATVTEGPPTATRTNTPLPTATPTITPTSAPCMQTILQGDSLIGAITRCGYRTLEVMPTVMALNNITDAGNIRAGQEIVIPWPTETPDPNAPTEEPTEPANGGNGANGDEDSSSLDDDPFALREIVDPFAPTATATLPPGVMWHTVQSQENIIVIALAYNIDAKILSELNPEVDFARCEFGERFGGPECMVPLFEGQRLRVPEPTPLPTLSPTPDPNATATPTPTPTFNRPNALSPSDGRFFNRNDLVILRWASTGTLAPGEVYLVQVNDVTTGERFTATTRELSYTIPLEWQGRISQRHNYTWTVGIITEGQPDRIRFETSPLGFVWQGLAESN